MTEVAAKLCEETSRQLWPSAACGIKHLNIIRFKAEAVGSFLQYDKVIYTVKHNTYTVN